MNKQKPTKKTAKNQTKNAPQNHTEVSAQMLPGTSDSVMLHLSAGFPNDRVCLVWWLLWLQDEICGEYYLATCKLVSVAAEFPPRGTWWGQSWVWFWGVGGSGPACRAKKGLRGEGRGIAFISASGSFT